jgi:F-type H+-transporting ATPase subunit alpha
MNENAPNEPRKLLKQSLSDFAKRLDHHKPALRRSEIGRVDRTEGGIAYVTGLSDVGYEEIVSFKGGETGLVLDLRAAKIGVVILSDPENIEAGDTVYRTHRIAEIPAGPDALGRLLDPLGAPLDKKEPPRAVTRQIIDAEAPPIRHRQPVRVPLQTGIKAIDSMIPVGRGQRELIVGDRQTGKTSVAVDTLINQKETDVISIYCAIGQRTSATADVFEALKRHNAMEETIGVIAEGDDPIGLQYLAPYSAFALGEYFASQGRDVVIVLDDLTQHAQAYRELSLLMRRPPGREAYPGDIFYIHSRLLERATNLREEFGGGSITALPVVETSAENISGYIPTNLISITDGQIYLSPKLFQKGILPAIDVGRSVSRVGGKTQRPIYRSIAGELKLAQSQYEELESFARFGTQLEPKTAARLERGRRIRQILRQRRHEPLPISAQIIQLVAVLDGFLDDTPVEDIRDAAQSLSSEVRQSHPELFVQLPQAESSDSPLLDKLRDIIGQQLGKEQADGTTKTTDEKTG